MASTNQNATTTTTTMNQPDAAMNLAQSGADHATTGAALQPTSTTTAPAMDVAQSGATTAAVPSESGTTTTSQHDAATAPDNMTTPATAAATMPDATESGADGAAQTQQGTMTASQHGADTASATATAPMTDGTPGSIDGAAQTQQGAMTATQHGADAASATATTPMTDGTQGSTAQTQQGATTATQHSADAASGNLTGLVDNIASGEAGHGIHAGAFNEIAGILKQLGANIEAAHSGDTLTGTSDSDVFVLRPGNENVTINGFDPAHDVLVVLDPGKAGHVHDQSAHDVTVAANGTSSTDIVLDHNGQADHTIATVTGVTSDHITAGHDFFALARAVRDAPRGPPRGAAAQPSCSSTTSRRSWVGRDTSLQPRKAARSRESIALEAFACVRHRPRRSADTASVFASPPGRVRRGCGRACAKRRRSCAPSPPPASGRGRRRRPAS